MYKTTSMYIDDESSKSWLYDYWWVIAIALVLLIALVVWTYIRQTRLHNIVLYTGKEPTTVTVQHGKTFPAPIPDVDGEFCGWYRDSAYTIPFNSSDKVVSDFSLYAKIK